MLSTKRRVSRASLLSVSTTIPSKTGVVQAVCTPRARSTDTTHSRHAPTLLRSGWWQRVGMRMPASRAASRMVAPSGATTRWLLMVRVMVMYMLSDEMT